MKKIKYIVEMETLDLILIGCETEEEAKLHMQKLKQKATTNSNTYMRILNQKEFKEDYGEYYK
jgi:hypothetical protein